MNIKDFYLQEGELPLDRLVWDGGFCRIFRSIACIGDSLSSGEFESCSATGAREYHDMYDYSWGQYIARATGARVYNFSRGGMTAKEYVEGYAESRGWWDPSLACQAYILALGVNDICGRRQPLGDLRDIDPEDPFRNADTFCGWYAAILQRIRAFCPDARFFLMTMPRSGSERDVLRAAHAALLHRLAGYFDNTYVIDLNAYAPMHDEAFVRAFYLGSHLNPMGYVLTATQVMSYIDYLIRANPSAFAKVPFIGTSLGATELRT